MTVPLSSLLIPPSTLPPPSLPPPEKKNDICNYRRISRERIFHYGVMNRIKLQSLQFYINTKKLNLHHVKSVIIFAEMVSDNPSATSSLWHRQPVSNIWIHQLPKPVSSKSTAKFSRVSTSASHFNHRGHRSHRSQHHRRHRSHQRHRSQAFLRRHRSSRNHLHQQSRQC